MNIDKSTTVQLVYLWVLWILSTLIYFHQYALRVIVSSLSHYLIADFSLTIIDLTDLAVLFFIAYIIILPIAGVLLDRYGIKKMLPLASFIMGISCFLFADSRSETDLVIARILMGGSASFSLLASLIIIRKYFKASLFPILSGLTLSIGIFGCIFGNWFLVYESHTVSWRLLIRYSGLIALLLAAGFFINMYLGEKNKQQTPATKTVSLAKFLSDIKLFLNQWNNWLPGIYGGFSLVPIVAFASFWSSPFLQLNYHMSSNHAAYFTSYIFIGYAVGAPIIAQLAQKIGLKPMMILSAGLALVSMMLLINIALPFALLMLCLFSLGFTAGSFALTTIAIKLSTPQDITASCFSFSAMLSQLIAALVLWLMGQYIFYFHGVNIVQTHRIYSPIILKHTMELLAAASFLGLVTTCFIRRR